MSVSLYQVLPAELLASQGPLLGLFSVIWLHSLHLIDLSFCALPRVILYLHTVLEVGEFKSLVSEEVERLRD